MEINKSFDNLQVPETFIEQFRTLTGAPPFPWQRKLFAEFYDTALPRFRPQCSVPTGLGKTSVIAIWLLALAYKVMSGKADCFPRRLAYVVNRRTVVDQASFEAERLRVALQEKPELAAVKNALMQLATDDRDGGPIAISTLRGEFADNGEWRSDPARPAIIVGTVDMIGSRLLFSGYGRCGFKSKPLHAGLLGQDTLVVHDEAHLEPAFQRLLEAVAGEQRRRRGGDDLADARPLRIMALSATVRGNDAQDTAQDQDEPLFGKEDEEHEIAGKRLKARKWLDFHPAGGEELAGKVVSKALELDSQDPGRAILVFLRRVEDVKKVADLLRKKKPDAVQTLTGTQRGWERDQLANSDRIFARFLPPKDRRVEPKEDTVYLVCTSAGEVGVNLSADHLVCDVTPLDSMIQRFGRVNRFGNDDEDGKPIEARIEVVFIPDESTGKKTKEKTSYDLACEYTLKLLRDRPECKDKNGRPGRLASSAVLSEMLGGLSVDVRNLAFTPEPVILPTTDILFDAWALTTVRGKLPGRPPVADWLHGLAEWEPPETHVAWREEVAIITGPLLQTYPPDELLEDYPLKPHEQLRQRSKPVFEHLKRIAARAPALPAWLVDREGELRVLTLAELAAQDSETVEHATVILPPRAGGLSDTGLLDGNATWAEGEGRPAYDVADEWRDPKGQPNRARVWDHAYKPSGMRLVRCIDLPAEAGDEDDDEPEARSWLWYVRPRSADDDGSRVARKTQELETHLNWTGEFADRLVKKLCLEPNLAHAVVLAARCHDLGKNRRIWQRSIGNPNPSNILAKSGPGMRPLEITRYRHEFGSLLDVADDEEFKKLDLELQELVLHLIAAHHGRARPHFPAEEAFDPESLGRNVQAVTAVVPQQFARLQRRYGRWGLAWLESLVRAADAMASNAILQVDDA